MLAQCKCPNCGAYRVSEDYTAAWATIMVMLGGVMLAVPVLAFQMPTAGVPGEVIRWVLAIGALGIAILVGGVALHLHGPLSVQCMKCGYKWRPRDGSQV